MVFSSPTPQKKRPLKVSVSMLRLFVRGCCCVVASPNVHVFTEADLLEALNAGALLGAGLDVFDPEPPHPKNPLLHHPRVTLSPHLGSSTVQAREAMAALAVRNLLAVLDGRPAITPI